MSDVEVRRNAPINPSSPPPGSTEFVVDYPLPELERGRAPQIEEVAAQPELQYSAREKPSRRLVRRLRTPALILVACVLAGALLPRSWRHAQLLRLTSACFDHRVPPGTVAVAFGAGKDHPLASDPRYEDLPPQARGLVPPYWRELHERLHGSRLQTCGTAFLGTRRNRGTNEDRLVAVDVVHYGSTHSSLQFAWRVYDRGSARTGPIALNVGVAGPGQVRPFRGPLPVIVYAGVADPHDDTHFTIEVAFEKLDRRFIVDGWLRGDNVVLIPRDTSDAMTTRPAPSSPALFPTPGLPVIPETVDPAAQ